MRAQSGMCWCFSTTAFASRKTGFALPAKPVCSRIPASPQHKGRPMWLQNTPDKLCGAWWPSGFCHAAFTLTQNLPHFLLKLGASLLYFFIFRNGIHFYLRMLQRIHPSMCCAVFYTLQDLRLPHKPRTRSLQPLQGIHKPQGSLGFFFNISPSQDRLLGIYLYLPYICVRAWDLLGK